MQIPDLSNYEMCEHCGGIYLREKIQEIERADQKKVKACAHCIDIMMRLSQSKLCNFCGVMTHRDFFTTAMINGKEEECCITCKNVAVVCGRLVRVDATIQKAFKDVKEKRIITDLG